MFFFYVKSNSFTIRKLLLRYVTGDLSEKGNSTTLSEIKKNIVYKLSNLDFVNFPTTNNKTLFIT